MQSLNCILSTEVDGLIVWVGADGLMVWAGADDLMVWAGADGLMVWASALHTEGHGFMSSVGIFPGFFVFVFFFVGIFAV